MRISHAVVFVPFRVKLLLTIMVVDFTVYVGVCRMSHRSSGRPVSQSLTPFPPFRRGDQCPHDIEELDHEAGTAFGVIHSEIVALDSANVRSRV